MKRTKYPRTFHLPWSNPSSDDKMLDSTNHFVGKEVVVTEKMDGESFTGYSDGYTHARSIDSKNHLSRNASKQIFGNIWHNLPYGYRICAENVYAKHSIEYKNLKSYLYGFSIWNESNICLDWDTTIKLFDNWNITPVKVLYRGIYNENDIKGLWDESKRDSIEGYVMRTTSEIPFDKFNLNYAKFVRKNHVNTSDHWMTEQIIPNIIDHS